MVDLDQRFREADRIEIPDRWTEISARVPLERLPEGPPQHRVLVVVLALVVAVAGIVVAWAALRPGAAPAPADTRASNFTAVWPETSWEDALTAQQAVNQGANQWRLDPVAVAERFARTFMGWTRVNSSVHGPQRPGAVSVNVGLFPYHGPGPAPMVTVEMRQLVTLGTHGIWSVTKVGSPYLRFDIASGASVGMRQRIPVTALSGRWITVFGVNPRLKCEAPAGRQSLTIPGPQYPQTRTPQRLTVPVYPDPNPNTCPSIPSGPAVLFLAQITPKGGVGDLLYSIPPGFLPRAQTVAAVAVQLTNAKQPQRATSTPSPTQSCQIAAGAFGLFRGCFDPNTNPFRGDGAAEVTFAQAQSAASFPIYAPQTSPADDHTLTHAWIGVEAGGGGMLPRHDLTEVALSYASGIQITYVPWQYGPKAPPFSEEQAAAHYRQVASEGPAGTFTVVTIDGIPALVAQENLEATDNPWGIDLQLGSANDNAVTVHIRGRHDPAELEVVAGSIISQWKAAGSGAG